MNRKKLFLAGAIGNSIEVFEAVVYGFLHPFIASTFFPANFKNNLLFFFFTIILSFLARPLGALYFGVMGDLKGRKPVLELTMLLSGISCCLMAVIPSFQQAGYLSFFLLVLFRFSFGLAMSGEYNNSFLYLAEQSAPKSRGYILSWAAFGVSFGFFLATFTSYLFTSLIENQIIPEWTFRIIFLFSALSIYIGYVARRELTETPEFFISYPSFEEKKKRAIYNIAKNELQGRLQQSLKIILLSGYGTHLTYTLLFYAPFHLVTYNIHSFSFKETTLLITLSSFIAALTIPLFGKLSDKIGRQFLLMVSLVTTTVLYLLFFFKIAPYGTYQELIYFYALAGIFNGMYFCIAPAEIINSLPNKMRSTINGLLYGIPAIVCGAFSLPYFQAMFKNHPESPLIILVLSIPLFMFFSFSRKGLFEASHEYIYPLEKTKVS